MEPLLPLFHGKRVQLDTSSVLVTQEGAAPVLELLQVLNALAPRPPLELRAGLCSAATAHALDIGLHGSTSHDGSDGSDALPPRLLRMETQSRLAARRRVARGTLRDGTLYVARPEATPLPFDGRRRCRRAWSALASGGAASVRT